MINLARTRFIVTAYSDNRWPVELTWWIETLTKDIKTRDDYRVSINKRHMICARNVAILEGALQSDPHFDWFVFADKDVRPDNRTARFLELETDVKCCQVEQGRKDAWSWPDDFHDSIWCTSRKVLESIAPPWFTEHKLNETGTELIGCMCNTFRAKVLEAGFTISHGGWAEHDRDQSWC